ncbi:MAG: hypothetical protein H6709_09675 [Kofleriaceae bacterium]|nr:hypothetical protein [Myxococcales bacterium]MCB9565548.1 hypothetical protein [Kofleriaceae bacterium]MCB9572341.1 hypothetical protein [Kofleriaceae bacterium]
MRRLPFIISFALAGAALTSGCTVVENAADPGAIPSLDEARFRCGVEPILARDCSYAACHGAAGTPLRVYTVGRLRAGPSATIDDRLMPMTDAEHHANYQSAVAFAFGGVSPDDNFLLRKALPAEDGGFEHKGGAIFSGLDDPRAVALHTWLSGGDPCSGGTP